MPDAQSNPLPPALRWLTAHTGFPASRLPAKAELLLLIAAAANAAGTGPEGGPTGGARPGPERDFNARIRGYTIQRRRVHLKIDNSAKT